MGKECCWEAQIRDTQAAMLKWGKECCWEAQIRDTQAAMLKWGRNVAGRLRLETRRQQC